jgi:hypothetical protein
MTLWIIELRFLFVWLTNRPSSIPERHARLIIAFTLGQSAELQLMRE